MDRKACVVLVEPTDEPSKARVVGLRKGGVVLAYGRTTGTTLPPLTCPIARQAEREKRGVLRVLSSEPIVTNGVLTVKRSLTPSEEGQVTSMITTSSVRYLVLSETVSFGLTHS